MRAIVLGLVATAAIALTSGAVRAAGIITTVAGGGPAPNISATAQPLSAATSVLFDPSGHLCTATTGKRPALRCTGTP